jgi:hypothetical protein
VAIIEPLGDQSVVLLPALGRVVFSQVVVPAIEPFRETIVGKLEQGLSGQRIYQDLLDEEDGFTASYSSGRRFIANLRQTHPLPVRRLETPPGEEAQVDFGRGARVISPDGRR